MSRAALNTTTPVPKTPPPIQTVCVVSAAAAPQIITNTGTTCGMNIMLPDTENAPPSEMVERVTKASRAVLVFKAMIKTALEGSDATT